MVKDILANILDDSIDDSRISGKNSIDSQSNEDEEEEEEDDDSSVIIDVKNSDALRLDEFHSQGITDASKSLQKKQLFYTGDEEEETEREEFGILSPHKKQVRFNNKRDEGYSDQESRLHPWELKRVIRKEFREKLPNNYEIKRWKRPSKIMIGSVIQLLETNVETALDQVFKKYESELQTILVSSNDQTSKIYRQKQSIMNDIVSKIKNQLKRSKFPSRISDRDLDIEYIVSKRKFIQKRYSEELNNAERLEKELLKEQKMLQEAQESCKNLRENNKSRLTERLVQNSLHPSLNKAVENAYGLITDKDKTDLTGQMAFKRDLNELNLELTDKLETPADSIQDNQEIYNSLPSLQEYNKVSQDLLKNISEFAKEEQQIVIKNLFNGPDLN